MRSGKLARDVFLNEWHYTVGASFTSSRWVLHVLHDALVSLVVLYTLCDRQRASLFVCCGDGVLCLRVGR
jgi:hypothetical protein